MTLRPPRRPFSVSRQLSERARAAASPEQPSAAGGPNIAGLDGVTSIAGFDGVAGMVGALRGLVEQLAAAAQQQASPIKPRLTGTSMPPVKTPTRSRWVAARPAWCSATLLRMGADGISAEPFGNVPDPAESARRQTRRRHRVTPAALQPIVEVYQDGDTVVVIAELPGADPERIVCRADGVRLLIEAAGRAPLPQGSDAAGAGAVGRHRAELSRTASWKSA